MAERGLGQEGCEGFEFPQGAPGDYVGDMGGAEVCVLFGGGLFAPTRAIPLVAKLDGARGGRADCGVEGVQARIVATGMVAVVDGGVSEQVVCGR